MADILKYAAWLMSTGIALAGSWLFEFTTVRLDGRRQLTRPGRWFLPVVILGVVVGFAAQFKSDADNRRDVETKKAVLEEQKNNIERLAGEPLFSVDDIKNVFAKSKVRLSADARGRLYALANMPECGGLRAATNALRLSIHVFQKSRKSIDAITADMLCRASRVLHGLEGAKQIEHRIEDARRVA